MRTYYLKTKLTRAALIEKFRQHTLLEIKHAYNNPHTEKFFSGTVSDEEAWLSSITVKYRLSPYIQVLFRGIEEDMYLVLTPRMYSNAAFPLLLSLFSGTSLYLLYRLFAVWKWQALNMMEFWVLAPVLLFLSVFMLLRRLAFSKSKECTLDFVRTLCDAEVVKKEDVPGVFLLR
ncbi:MAG: hypothetical protein KJS92_01880 [Bacteroidetes bacterium]|nr:hypothetical protein [Bacteroidota bacterium]